jgi:type II secretory pathway pseudopilin PulG
MFIRNRSGQMGHILLETLVSQLIAGITAAALLSLIAVTYRLDRKASQYQRLIHTTSVIRAYSGRIIALSDTHRLDIPPQAGAPGSVTSIDGRTIGEILSGSSVAPSPRHSALYHFGVAAGSIFHLSASASSSPRCTTVPLSYPAERYEYGIVVTSTRVIVARITLRQADTKRRCYRVVIGSALRTLVRLPGSESAPEKGLRALLPIEREEALYVDRHERVRYLRLEGGAVVENQPVADLINDLSLLVSRSATARSTVYSAAVTLELLGLPKITFSVSSQLGRHAWWNTLLWML